MVTNACQQHSLEQKDYRFSRRDIRECTGWSDNQLKVHCARLSELEYLLVHNGHRGKRLEYELLYDNANEDSSAHLMGLIDSQTLSNTPKKGKYDENKLGVSATKLVPSCPQVGAKLAQVNPRKPINGVALSESGLAQRENTLQA